MKTTYLSSLLVLGLFLSAQSAQRVTSPLSEFMHSQGYDVIPLQYRKPNHLVVAARINSTRVLASIDTGSTETALDQNRARGLKRIGKLTEPIHGLFGQIKGPLERVSIGRLELAGVSFTNQPALIFNMGQEREVHTGSFIAAPTGPEGPELILGLDFLKAHYAFINCRAPCLYLRTEPLPPEKSEELEQTLRASGMTVTNLLEFGAFYVKTTVGDSPALFLVDTGASFTVIDWNQLEALKLPHRDALGEAHDLASNKRELQFTDVPSFKIGACEMKKLRVGVLSLKETNTERQQLGLKPIQGILGPEVLYQGCALIDCAGKRLFLAPTPSP